MTPASSKVLIRDDQGTPIAVSCHQCGRFCLDVTSCLCAACSLAKLLRPSAKTAGARGVL